MSDQEDIEQGAVGGGFTSGSEVEKQSAKKSPKSKEKADMESERRDMAHLQKVCKMIVNTLRELNAKGEGPRHLAAKACIDTLNEEVAEILDEVKAKRRESEGANTAFQTDKSVRSKRPKPSKRDSISDNKEEVQKALRKQRKERKEVPDSTDEDRESDSDVSNPTSSDESHSDSDVGRRSHGSESRKRRRKSKRSSDYVRMSEMTTLMSRLDSRFTPRPEKYDSRSGQSLKEYLKVFEDYCSETFRGSSTLWVGELGRYLTGEMHKAYSTLKSVGDDYATIKRKLLQWRKDSREINDQRTKNRFRRATMRQGEGLRMYAVRLEKAFHLAYPDKPSETSEKLRRKFFDTVPENVRDKLVTTRSMGVAMNGKEIKWSLIRSIVSTLEADLVQVIDSSDDESDEPTITWERKPNNHVRHTESREYNDSGNRSGKWSSNKTSEPRQSEKRQNKKFTKVYTSHKVTTNENAKASGYSGKSRSTRGSSNSDTTRETRTCLFCKKKGHIKANCWRAKGLCLVCGSSEHKIASCPNRRELRRNKSVQTPRDESPEDEVSSRDREPSRRDTYRSNRGKGRGGYRGNRSSRENLN
ncbi:hypothetical protein HYZ97_03935 [Candidatus Pacearchaeota archaeon]|nr:hypothetical protein [Candidatus Pacearchaeota archaeon]